MTRSDPSPPPGRAVTVTSKNGRTSRDALNCLTKIVLLFTPKPILTPLSSFPITILGTQSAFLFVLLCFLYILSLTWSRLSSGRSGAPRLLPLHSYPTSREGGALLRPARLVLLLRLLLARLLRRSPHLLPGFSGGERRAGGVHDYLFPWKCGKRLWLTERKMSLCTFGNYQQKRNAMKVFLLIFG